jgi:hypothetical protein
MYQDKTITKEKSRLLLIAAVMTFSIIAAMTFNSCDKTDDPALRSYWVAGIVTDSLTKLPIDSAVVWWHDTAGAPPIGQVYTDSSGRYVLGVPESTSRKISAGKSGYVTKTIPTGVSWSADTVRINMELAVE